MATFDFPSSPTVGQAYGAYTWDGEKWTLAAATAISPATATPLIESGAGAVGASVKYAREDHVHPALYIKKNYIINGAMMVSQENGANPGTTSGYYPVDQWSVDASGLTTGTFKTEQSGPTSTPVGVPSLAGSPNRLRVTATAVQATGHTVMLMQKIEGLRAADLKWGEATAKTVTFQFGVKAPAGTWLVAIYNSATSIAVNGSFTISGGAGGEANTDVVKQVVFPGATTGAWLKDSGVGLWVVIYLAANNPAWGNLWAVNSSVFELSDVSLTEGTVPPPFVVPDYASELAACQRYFYRRNYASGAIIGTLQAYSTTGASGVLCDFPVTMRAPPVVAASAPNTFSLSSAVGSGTVTTSAPVVTTVDAANLQGVTIGSAGVAAGNCTLMVAATAAFHQFNARL